MKNKSSKFSVVVLVIMFFSLNIFGATQTEWKMFELQSSKNLSLYETAIANPILPNKYFQPDLFNLGNYGAIAYSPSTRSFGSAWNYSSLEEAENNALSMCKRGDCIIVASLADNCGALAVARNGGYVWSSDAKTLRDAKLYASNECTRRHSSCKLICSVCSGGDNP